MKKFIVAILIFIIGSAALMGGCTSDKEFEDVSKRLATIEQEDSKYLITVNAPVQWGEASRIGTFYFIYQLAEILIATEGIEEVNVYFGPEASEMATKNGAETYILPDPLKESLGAENMAEWGKLVSEKGINFYASDMAIAIHQLEAQDYVTPISLEEFAELSESCGKILRY